MSLLSGKPASPPGHPVLSGYEVYPLHFLDNHQGFKEVYTYTLQFNDVLDADELHKSLNRLLQFGDWRKLGGRIRTNKQAKNGKLEIHVPVTFTAQHHSVAYTHLVYRSKLREHPLGFKLPRSTGTQGSIQEGADYFRDFSATQVTPKNFSDFVDSDVPLLSLHVICFSDATLVSLAWPHVLMDGSGFQALLQAWSHMLAGRDSAVPRLLGARDDVLTEACESKVAREEYVFESTLIKGFGVILLILFTIWDHIFGFFRNKKMQNRTLFLPKGIVGKLRAQAFEDISRANRAREDKLWVSESDVILSWFIQKTALCEPKPRPVTVFAAFDFRARLPDFIQRGGVYVQNLAWLSMTSLPAETARGPLGPLALAYRKSLQEQTTQGQVLSLVRKLKAKWDAGSTLPLVSGPLNAIFYPAGNLVKLDFLRAAAFGPAVFKQGDESPARKNPLGTCVYHHKGFWNEKRVSKKGMFILGKDWDDNYWVTGYGTRSFWRALKTSMDDLTEGSASDSAEV